MQAAPKEQQLGVFGSSCLTLAQCPALPLRKHLFSRWDFTADHWTVTTWNSPLSPPLPALFRYKNVIGKVGKKKKVNKETFWYALYLLYSSLHCPNSWWNNYCFFFFKEPTELKWIQLKFLNSEQGTFSFTFKKKKKNRLLILYKCLSIRKWHTKWRKAPFL